jgi:hypothetical protein
MTTDDASYTAEGYYDDGFPEKVQLVAPRAWHDVGLRELHWFFLKAAIAAIPSAALLFSVYIFSVVFMRIALAIITGGE